MSRIFAIGDVHGCNATLHKLVTEKIQPGKSDHLCFIGDYIDRGPDSKGVVDYILQLEGEGFNIHTLRGNHEQIMLDSVNSEDDFELWRVNGGVQTMRSYGISSFNEMSQDHQDFFQNTSH